MKLFNILNTNVLPNYTNIFLEGSNIPNQNIEAGLPNITGAMDTDGSGNFYKIPITFN